MSIATVVTHGFGSFGDIAHVVTLGYDISGTPPPTPPVVTNTQAGGSGKDRRNEIIEINGARWSVPKDQVAEFLAQVQPKPSGVKTDTVKFTTPTGRVVTTTQQVLQDDIGLILMMAALADEDFYQ